MHLREQSSDSTPRQMFSLREQKSVEQLTPIRIPSSRSHSHSKVTIVGGNKRLNTNTYIVTQNIGNDVFDTFRSFESTDRHLSSSQQTPQRSFHGLPTTAKEVAYFDRRDVPKNANLQSYANVSVAQDRKKLIPLMSSSSQEVTRNSFGQDRKMNDERLQSYKNPSPGI